MKFLDAIASIPFKTVEDGRLLFFPRGTLGRGYVVPSNEEAARLRRQYKYLMLLCIVAAVGVAELMTFGFFVAAAVVGTLLIAAMEIWTWCSRRRLRPSNERLSVRESMRKAALSYSAAVVWFGTITMLLMFMLFASLLMIQPGDWIWWMLGIVFCGLVLAMYVWMILLRRSHRRISSVTH